MLHITMIIKMIATQVGKHRRGKLQRRNAMLYQTVRRNFHRGKGCPLPCQTGKNMLYVNCRAGGVFCWADFAQQAVTHGAHYRASFSQQLGPLRHQLRGGGFSVRARHANQTQLVGRFVIKTSCQSRETFIQLAEIDNRHTVHFTDLTVGCLIFGLSNNGSNTLRNRLRDITTPVRLMTDHRHKKIARSRNAAVQYHLSQCSLRCIWHPRSEKVAQITICHLYPRLD